MLKYIEVRVRRNEVHSQNLIVPEWEVPVLEAIHDQVSYVRDHNVNRKAPTAAEEITRLETRYGLSRDDNGSRGEPYVRLVYGQLGLGLRRLQQAIDGATFEDGETPAVRSALPQVHDDLIGEAPLVSAGG